MIQNITRAATYLAGKTTCIPELAIVLGSGLGGVAEAVSNPISIPYADINGCPVSTTPGHAAKLLFGELEGKNVVVMQGRCHFYEGYTFEEIVFPLRVLRALGVKSVLLTNAVGGVNKSFSPGDLMLITDHINLFGASPLRGANIAELGPRFPDMTTVYDKDYMDFMRKSAMDKGIALHEGVYMFFPGPQFETPAEIQAARVLGADAVGMSTVPEAIAARHMGMRICGVSCITNLAAGMSDKPLTHEEVMETGSRANAALETLLRGFVALLQ